MIHFTVELTRKIMSNGKVMMIFLIVGLIKRNCYIKLVAFQNQISKVKTNIKV